MVLDLIEDSPESLHFDDIIEYIERYYHFTPSSFRNGELLNEAGQNNGSCKVFAFGLINKLTKEQTLHCFGEYYRKDVLQNPQAEDHLNIRNFIRTGWEGIEFFSQPLIPK